MASRGSQDSLVTESLPLGSQGSDFEIQINDVSPYNIHSPPEPTLSHMDSPFPLSHLFFQSPPLKSAFSPANGWLTWARVLLQQHFSDWRLIWNQSVGILLVTSEPKNNYVSPPPTGSMTPSRALASWVQTHQGQYDQLLAFTLHRGCVLGLWEIFKDLFFPPFDIYFTWVRMLASIARSRINHCWCQKEKAAFWIFLGTKQDCSKAPYPSCVGQALTEHLLNQPKRIHQRTRVPQGYYMLFI